MWNANLKPNFLKKKKVLRKFLGIERKSKVEGMCGLGCWISEIGTIGLDSVCFYKGNYCAWVSTMEEDNLATQHSF